MRVRWLAAFGLVLPAIAPVYGQSTVSLIDTAGNVGGNPAIAIAGGTGLIAYRDELLLKLKVAHCTNAVCDSAIISTVDSTFMVGRVSAIAVGTDGSGIIAYSDDSIGALKVAHCSDGDCTSATITTLDDGYVAGRPSLAIGGDGLPLIVSSRWQATSTELISVHCSNVSCTSFTTATLTTLGNPQVPFGYDTALAIGTDQRGLISYVPVESLPGPDAEIAMAHCADLACTALEPPAASAKPAARAALGGPSRVRLPTLIIGSDGRGLVSYLHEADFGTPQVVREQRIRHCADVACTSFSSNVVLPEYPSSDRIPLALGADGKPWFARPMNQRMHLYRCTDGSCGGWTESCAVLGGTAGAVALARGADDEPFAAFHALVGGDLGVIHGFDPCLPSLVNIADLAVEEYDYPNVATIILSVDVPPDTDATVDYATVAGTASPGKDYQPVSGTVTFNTHGNASPIFVPTEGDLIDEPDETFSVVLSNPQGLALGDATGVVTIRDNDPEPGVRIDGCNVAEGTAVSHACAFQVSLSRESGKAIEVPYSTQDETAHAGSDYGAAAGTLSMAPGAVTVAVPVTITGDSLVEDDETFAIALGTPVNAVLVESQAQGVILDDDAPSLSRIELTHGTTLAADLAAQPGPTADVDHYRLAQPPLTSWEATLDGVSGDLAPALALDRLAADNSTVLQSGVAEGTGASVSLRFQNRLEAPILGQHLRVSGGCATDCGADDVYRFRLRETTLRLPRFNNTLLQFTVLLLQNRTAASVHATIDFWDETGRRVVSRPATLPPHGLLVLDTWNIPGLAMVSGSATVTNDAPYGGLAGKAVALQPSVGFSLDSPLEYKAP